MNVELPLIFGAEVMIPIQHRKEALQQLGLLRRKLGACQGIQRNPEAVGDVDRGIQGSAPIRKHGLQRGLVNAQFPRKFCQGQVLIDENLFEVHRQVTGLVHTISSLK